LYRKHAPGPEYTDLAVNPEVIENIKGLTLADADVPLVHELDLEALPVGRISKLWVVLFEDALKPMTVPVIIAKGVSFPVSLTDFRRSTWSCGWDDFLVTRRRSEWRTSYSSTLSK